MAEADIEDDTSILAAAKFLRRIPPNRLAQTLQPDSSNFEERSDNTGLSVTLWETANDLEITAAEMPNFGIVSVTAALLREAGYAIVRVPLPDNPNHCECYGSPSKGKRRQLASNAKWVKLPEGYDPADFGCLGDTGQVG